MLVCFYLFIFCHLARSELNRISLSTDMTNDIKRQITMQSFQRRDTRRILKGEEVGETRPYMVYLRPATNETLPNPLWLCGGAIIHERYILTSAACIEDVERFYVVSGTSTWVAHDDNSNPCVINGAKKAVWKCVPKNFYYDGNEFDNIRWMAEDIAVVKVEDNFNFNKRVRGCDFVPQKVDYNNKSADYEKPKTLASIAGWGSKSAFQSVVAKIPPVGRQANDTTQIDDKEQPKPHSGNSEVLLETDTIILSKKTCKKRWPERYHHIIDKHMICGKDGLDTASMSKACTDVVNCKELISSESDEDEDAGARRQLNRTQIDARRAKPVSSGFCENDHGGPLIVGHGKTSMIIGIISATQTREGSMQCFGPFLYTSVYNNRNLIACALDKNLAERCRSVLRASRSMLIETHINWRSTPDGPVKPQSDEKFSTTSSKKKHDKSTTKTLLL